MRALLFLIFFIFTACGGDNNSKVKAPPSVDDGGIDTPIGTVSATGFWIRSQNREFPTYVNKSDGFGNECIIKSEDGLGTISCYVDVMELDLYSNEVSLQYNIPPDMCQHIAITPSWHWNYSSGRGPRNITLEVTATDAGERIDSCAASRDDGASDEDCTPGTNGHPEIAGFNESGLPNCVYDHSIRNTDLPNCCLGTYNILKRLDSNGDGTYETVTSNTDNWGGDVTACIGGGPKNGVGRS